MPNLHTRSKVTVRWSARAGDVTGDHPSDPKTWQRELLSPRQAFEFEHNLRRRLGGTMYVIRYTVAGERITRDDLLTVVAEMDAKRSRILK